MKVKLIFIALLMVPWISFTAHSDVIQIKASAPATYVVKKGDTLWDISNLYLNQPWLWPELWRTNTHIHNPHLIYPGDVLRLVRDDQGNLALALARKPSIKLSPTGNRQAKADNPIPSLPWGLIAPYIRYAFITDEQHFSQYPYVLGNEQGAVRYAQQNRMLVQGEVDPNQALSVVRKHKVLRDLQGRPLGLQVTHIAEAQPIASELTQQTVVSVQTSQMEIKRGDRLIPAVTEPQQSLPITAATNQQGFIVDDLEQHHLLGKLNVVVIDIGKTDISPGSVMGIYRAGPNIVDGRNPLYQGEAGWIEGLLMGGKRVAQPQIKVGELLVFNTFDHASYALITQSTTVIKRGMLVARP